MEKNDRKVVGFLKECGLWETGKDRFWISLLVFLLGIISLVFLSKQAATVFLGILPALLLITGGYGLLDLFLSSRTETTSADPSLKEEIEILKEEIKKIKESKNQQ